MSELDPGRHSRGKGPGGGGCGGGGGGSSMSFYTPTLCWAGT